MCISIHTLWKPIYGGHDIRYKLQFVMGIFFKMEVLAFIEEAEPDHHGYDDYDDFMRQTKDNYQKVSMQINTSL